MIQQDRIFLNNKKMLIRWSSFSIVLIAIGMIGFKIINHANSMNMFLTTISYFTTQSVVLVGFVMGASILGKEDQKWFPYLAFIALMDILITAVVFNVVLVFMIEGYTFFYFMTHVIVPMVYLLYYYIFVSKTIKKQEIWIVLIHPLLFLVMVYTVIHPLLGEILVETVMEFDSSPYVYPFLDPQYFNNSIALTIIVNSVVLCPIALLLSYGLLYYKRIVERKNSQRNKTDLSSV